MRLWSEDFSQNGTIPRECTCDGRDISPHLAWDGVPEGTMSLALVIDDPDAPVGTWVHWLVCDIPSSISTIPKGTIPVGARQVMNDFGRPDYGGPCPPSGTHRYFHKLYALRVHHLEGANDKRTFVRMVEGSKLAEAVLVGSYKRSRW